jgi:acyl-CoA dehydrogenase
MTTTAEQQTSGATDWTAVATELAGGFADGVEARDVTGEIAVEAFDALRGAGLMSMLVPAEHGGGGASHAELGSVLRAIARVDGPTALTLSMHSHLVALQVWRHRHGMDASAVFEKVVGGAILISTGASDWVPSNGTAVREDGGYRVSARKSPASGCEVGTILVTSIRWDDAPDGPQVLHCVVPFTAEGVSIDKTWDTLGQRATGSHTVVLDDVFVPDAAVAMLRPADDWPPILNAVIGAALPLVMSPYLGIADAAVDAALDLVRGRRDAHVLQLVGEMLNAHTTADDLIEAAFLAADNLQFDATDELGSAGLRRKTVAADALIETVRLAIELSGGIGYTRSSVLERLYRDVHGSLFHPLPRAKQLTFSGRVALGMSPTG